MTEQGTARGRKSARLRIPDVPAAEFRIIAVGGRAVRTKPAKVLPVELGPEGLRFQTALWLPPDGEWTVSIHLAIEGVALDMAGTIVEALQDGPWWIYEMEFLPDPVIRHLVVRILNQRLRSRSPLLSRLHETYGRHLW